MKKIFIAIPNMGTLHQTILQRLSYWSSFTDYQFSVATTVEQRHVDNARNKLIEEFLKSDFEWLLFIDSDVDPNPSLPRMCEYDKDIIAANVLCWIKGEMHSSIWERAACEECKAVKLWREMGQNKDPREYVFDPARPDMLLRWNPSTSAWQEFCDRTKQDTEWACRCHWTGRDPYVYNTSQKIMEKTGPIEVDATGGAALMIRRSVFTILPPPWFQFLYRHNREVMVAEDLFFCYKAKLHGFSIWADQNMPCGHYKKINLLDVNNWAGTLYERGYERALKDIEGRMKKRDSLIVVPDFVQ